MKNYKTLVEFDKGNYRIIDNIKAESIDQIDEEYLRQNYPVLFRDNDDFIIVITAENSVDNHVLERMYLHLNMMAMFYERRYKPRVLKRSHIMYHLKPGVLFRYPYKSMIVYINDKYVAIDPIYSYAEMEKLINEPITDLKIIYITNLHYNSNIFTEWYKVT